METTCYQVKRAPSSGRCITTANVSASDSSLIRPTSEPRCHRHRSCSSLTSNSHFKPALSGNSINLRPADNLITSPGVTGAKHSWFRGSTGSSGRIGCSSDRLSSLTASKLAQVKEKATNVHLINWNEMNELEGRGAWAFLSNAHAAHFWQVTNVWGVQKFQEQTNCVVPVRVSSVVFSLLTATKLNYSQQLLLLNFSSLERQTRKWNFLFSLLVV